MPGGYVYRESRLERQDDHDEFTPSTTTSVSEMRQVMGLNLDRIRNAVEVLACRILEQKLENCIEICRCQQCIEDMYCLTMNRTAPLYYHSAKSFATRLKDQGPPGDLIEALHRAADHAIFQVGQNPSHG